MICCSHPCSRVTASSPWRRLGRDSRGSATVFMTVAVFAAIGFLCVGAAGTAGDEYMMDDWPGPSRVGLPLPSGPVNPRLQNSTNISVPKVRRRESSNPRALGSGNRISPSNLLWPSLGQWTLASNLGLEELHGRLAALASFQRPDRSTSLVLLRDHFPSGESRHKHNGAAGTGAGLLLQHWNHSGRRMAQTDFPHLSARLRRPTGSGGAFTDNVREFHALPTHVFKVHNTVPIDLNLDGFTDLLVVYSASGEPAANLYFLVLLRRDATKFSLSWDSRERPDEDYRNVDSTALKTPLASLVQPVVVDVNFDGYPDLIAQSVAPFPASTASGGRVVWMNHDGRFFVPYYFGTGTTASFLRPTSGAAPLPSISHPVHSSGSLDLNGDCVADLALDVVDAAGTRSVEIWLASPGATGARSGSSTSPLELNTPHYNYNSRVNLPRGASLFTFADINSDGTMDLLFAECAALRNGTCDDQTHIGKALTVIYNRQPPLCTTSIFGFAEYERDRTTAECRNPVQLCVPTDFSFKGPPVRSILNFGPAADTATENDFTAALVSGTVGEPLTLRIGDFDSDGYPDVLGIFKLSTSSEQRIGLWRNSLPLLLEKKSARIHRTGASSVPTATLYNIGNWIASLWGSIRSRNGTVEAAAQLQRGSHGLSTWELDAAVGGSGPLMSGGLLNDTALFQFHSMLAIPDYSVEQVSFFDFGEDGILDVIASARRPQSWWASLASAKDSDDLQIFGFIQSQLDALFLKGTGVAMSIPHSQRINGSPQYGSTFKIVGADFDGNVFARCAGQLIQSTHFSLSLPFVLIGLGRVTNFVNQLYFGTGRREADNQFEISESLQTAINHFPATGPFATAGDPLLSGNTSGVTLAGSRGIPNFRLLMPQGTNLLEDSPFSESDAERIPPGYFRQWLSVMPNSDVRIGAIPANYPSRWTIDYSLNPSKYFWRILAATVAVLAVLGIVVIILHRHEKTEELLEHQGFKRHFIAAV